MNCIVCDQELNAEIVYIKEKMFGTNELFEYQICPSCECIQIKSIPESLDRFYPLNYYSFTKQQNLRLKSQIRQLIWNNLSYFLNDFYYKPSFIDFGISYSDINRSILDIGCGDGKLLKTLKNYGFSDLTGIDPFIENDYKTKGLRLLKLDLENLHGKYHLIMSHNSLEHMPNPHYFFKNVIRLLKDEGRIILRIPVYPNYIWDRYYLDWIQLDAPRHLYTFSLKTIYYLCEKYRLHIRELKFDSAPWALASTEYCLNGKSHKEFEQNCLISEEQIAICKQANDSKYGDSVCLVLRKQ